MESAIWFLLFHDDLVLVWTTYLYSLIFANASDIIVVSF